MDTELASKLRNLVDRDEIWAVMLRFARGIDRFDRELVRSAYHDDATDDHGVFVGSANDFIDWALELHNNSQSITHHLLTNHSCEVDGDEAHAETYYTFIGVNLKPPHLLSMGRYVDHLQRRQGVWRISSRVCVIEHNFDIADSAVFGLAAPPPGLAPPLPATRDRDDLSYQRPLVPRRAPKPA